MPDVVISPVPRSPTTSTALLRASRGCTRAAWVFSGGPAAATSRSRARFGRPQQSANMPVVPEPAPSIPRVLALDGLRGLAVAAVVLFHAGHLAGGYLGVDVFFVLSGYLITTLLLCEHGSAGKVRLGAFWARRARRLLPALVLALFAVALWAGSRPSAEIAGLRGDALATIAYVANWHAIASGTDYWALFRSASPLEHTWSLAIEEQFYLVWPLVFVALASFRRATERTSRSLARRVLIVALVGSAISWLLMQARFEPADTARAYYGTDTRAASILIGVAFAALLSLHPAGGGVRVRRVLDVLAILAPLGLVLALVQLHGDDALLYRAGFLTSAIATIAIIATAVLLPHHPLSRLLGWRPFVALGLISYGVYLWHWPVDIVADSDRLGLTGWPLFTVQVCITLGLAIASYVFVEKPIRSGWGSRRFWLAATPAGAAALVAVVVLSTVATPPSAVASGEPVTIRAGLKLQQLALDRLVGAGTPRVLVTGDSLAFSLAAGANVGGEVPFGVANLGFLGCGIEAGMPIGVRTATPEAICARWPRAWRTGIDVFKPRAIVLLAGVWDIWPRRLHGRTLGLYSPALEANVRASLRAARRVAARAGIPLVVLTVPCLHPTAEAVGRAGAGLDDPRRVRWLNRLYRQFATTTIGVRLVDLGPYACRLPASRFTDGVHFSARGSRDVWTWLAPRLIAGLPPGPAGVNPSS